MVRSFVLALLILGGAVWGQDEGSDAEKGPTLYGDGGGRLWSWTGGEKTFLSAAGNNLVLGGVGEDSLWGWRVEGTWARFFTMELPKGEKDEKKPAQAAPAPVYDATPYPAPDRADLLGDRRLLVWGLQTGQPRYEVWKAGQLLAARAWDDGRSVYALALGPEEGWILAGRTADGAPWLEVSGQEVPPPDGWRGRLSVAAWVEEKEENKSGDPVSDQAQARPPSFPWAAGWGAPGSAAPRLLLWGPGGWNEPASAEEVPLVATYPLLGAAQDGRLVLAGWQADDGNGVLRPWFWDGEAAEVPGGAADGQPQAFSAGGQGGAFLVVRHQSPPWFTWEDGKESIPLLGLGSEDRVVAVAARAPSP